MFICIIYLKHTKLTNYLELNRSWGADSYEVAQELSKTSWNRKFITIVGGPDYGNSV
jgi:hypothetical protein